MDVGDVSGDIILQEGSSSSASYIDASICANVIVLLLVKAAMMKAIYDIIVDVNSDIIDSDIIVEEKRDHSISQMHERRADLQSSTFKKLYNCWKHIYRDISLASVRLRQKSE